jgi:hypothetical protein
VDEEGREEGVRLQVNVGLAGYSATIWQGLTIRAACSHRHKTDIAAIACGNKMRRQAQEADDARKANPLTAGRG